MLETTNFHGFFNFIFIPFQNWCYIQLYSVIFPILSILHSMDGFKGTSTGCHSFFTPKRFPLKPIHGTWTIWVTTFRLDLMGLISSLNLMGLGTANWWLVASWLFDQYLVVSNMNGLFSISYMGCHPKPIDNGYCTTILGWSHMLLLLPR